MRDNKILTLSKDGGRLVFGKRQTPEEQLATAQQEAVTLRAGLVAANDSTLMAMSALADVFEMALDLQDQILVLQEQLAGGGNG